MGTITQFSQKLENSQDPNLIERQIEGAFDKLPFQSIPSDESDEEFNSQAWKAPPRTVLEANAQHIVTHLEQDYYWLRRDHMTPSEWIYRWNKVKKINLNIWPLGSTYPEPETYQTFQKDHEKWQFELYSAYAF